MKDCIPALFDLIHRRYPYQPESPTERDEAQRREDALRSLKEAAPELRHQLFELTDADNILSCFRAHHAFRLGLGLGLSISREAEYP